LSVERLSFRTVGTRFTASPSFPNSNKTTEHTDHTEGHLARWDGMATTNYFNIELASLPGWA